MPRRAVRATNERPEDRWLLEEQTRRNLSGLEAEQAGRTDEAVAYYEQNAAEGFPGDWPYGRLVAIYEKRQAFDEAERVLRRAIAVFESSTRRTPQDRRAAVRAFRNRLRLLQRRRRAAGARSTSG
jgi:tetratricopeptide (TPR) repeat protein